METVTKYLAAAKDFWTTLTPQTKILLVSAVAGTALLALWLS